MEQKTAMTFDQLPVAVAEMKEDIKLLLSSTKQLIDGLHRPDTDKPSVDEPVGIERASQLTGLAVNTLYRYSRQGLIPAYKRGKRLIFYEAELNAWVHSGKRQSIEEKAAGAKYGIIQLTTDGK